MAATAPAPAALPSALRLLAAAPHRLLFFVGACNVLLAMGWWTLWLSAARWLDRPALARRHYLPVGLVLFGGQLLVLVGLWGHPRLIVAGLLLTTAGWAAGWTMLLDVLRRAGKSPRVDGEAG